LKITRINPAIIRVAINFNTVRKPKIFDAGVEEQDLLKIGLQTSVGC